MKQSIIVVAIYVLMTMSRSAYGAYAAFDQVQLLMPTWMHVPGIEGSTLLYRLSYTGLLTATLEVHNKDNSTQTVNLYVDEYQGNSKPILLTIPAQSTETVQVALQYPGCGLYRARVSAVPAQQFVEMSSPKNISPLATYVRLPIVTAHVRNDAIAYTISLRDGMVDIHFRNMSHDIVHANFSLLGLKHHITHPLPRLHLLPGTTSEIMLPLTLVENKTPDANRILDSIIELYQVRFGLEDDGNSYCEVSDGSGGTDPLWVPLGSYPVAVLGSAANSARFNPWVLAWDAHGEQITITNKSPTAISGTIHIRSGAQAVTHVVDIPAHGHVDVPMLTPGGVRPFVGISDPLLDGQPLIAAQKMLPPVALPEHALPVTPRMADHQFNPLSLVSTIERQGTDRARVTFYNATACAIRAEWSIAGYMPDNKNYDPILVPAGQSFTVEVPVKKVDIRLAVARVLVWNVTMGGQKLITVAP